MTCQRLMWLVVVFSYVLGSIRRQPQKHGWHFRSGFGSAQFTATPSIGVGNLQAMSSRIMLY